MSEPRERERTVRRALAAALRQGELTARELSVRLSIPEREVAEHLPHVERSLQRGVERLVVIAPRCLKCGFTFETRERRSKPSRCPACKGERLSPARFTIAATASK